MWCIWEYIWYIWCTKSIYEYLYTVHYEYMYVYVFVCIWCTMSIWAAGVDLLTRGPTLGPNQPRVLRNTPTNKPETLILQSNRKKKQTSSNFQFVLLSSLDGLVGR